MGDGSHLGAKNEYAAQKVVREIADDSVYLVVDDDIFHCYNMEKI